MSESQERMMAVVSPENVERFEAIMNKWGVEYSLSLIHILPIWRA